MSSTFQPITATFLDGICCDIPSQNWGPKEWARQFDAFVEMGSVPCSDNGASERRHKAATAKGLHYVPPRRGSDFFASWYRGLTPTAESRRSFGSLVTQFVAAL